MRPTGRYGLIYRNGYLIKRLMSQVNPHLVKRNKENRDNTQSKSDKKDALVIADMKQSMRLLLHSRFFPNNPFSTLVSTTVLLNFSGGYPVVEKDFLALNYSFSNDVN
ncbi:IS110 family transposase [Peribacillus butanolivorans]|nr:IS110 family transposase [Peribacillus butanolivorans]